MTERYIRNLIEKSQKEYGVEKYRDRDIAQTHTAFTGSPRKHPYDTGILILVPDPFSDAKVFYEITVDSIGLVEELGTLTDESGKSAMQVRVWVKKGKTAIESRPFTIR